MNYSAIGILKYALAREEEGEKFYIERSKSVKTPEVRDVLESLAAMENEHVNFIGRLIESLIKGEEFTHSEIEEKNFFKDREALELKGISIDDIVGDLSVLRMAYLIENDFVKFYEDSSRQTGSAEMEKTLKRLADWEAEHRNMIHEIYDSLMREYWNHQGFTPLY